METLYMPYLNGEINERAIKNMLKRDIEKIACQLLDEKFYGGRCKKNLDMMPGEAKIQTKVIARYAIEVLKTEVDKPPYRLLGLEWGEKRPWRVNDRYTVNFNMKIDRLDELEPGLLRIIDYKTGSDDIHAKKFDDIFTEHANQCIFQVLLYATVYRSWMDYSDDILPAIYRLISVSQDGLPFLKIGSEQNYREIRSDKDFFDEFKPRLEELIDKIFEEKNEYPFVQCAPDSQSCRYCKFSRLCGRDIKQ